MQPEERPEERPRPRWIFRGRPGAWDALMTSITTDPSNPAQWPIAPSGPSMSDGDAVLLWRSGRGGGIAALCSVVGEPEARPRPGGPPEVLIGLRIQRALGSPISPSTLLADPVLRPLAFMDLLETTEHRVTPAQEERLAALLERSGTVDPDAGADPVAGEARTAVEVPVRLVPLVRQLLDALGADEPPPASASPDLRGTAGAPATSPAAPIEPTDLQITQTQQLALRYGDATFTVDDAAETWRTGVGTSRSRIERLLESGLVARAGFLRSEERPGVRPTRGRPPVLYRLAVAPDPRPVAVPTSTP